MDRAYYLNLAASGLRMPIGAHLTLHEKPDPDAVARDGNQLGEVVIETARRYGTPLAIPLMDLDLEKTLWLSAAQIPAENIAQFHFETEPPPAPIAELETQPMTSRPARFRAILEAVSLVAGQPDLLPIGMAIGPFSLMTKLVRNPIAAIFAAGRGASDNNAPAVAILERVLDQAVQIVTWSVRRQCAAGAKAIVICEPAAGTAYVSPRQMTGKADVFDRYVITPHRRLKAVLDECGADLIFHDCAEVTDEMLRRIVELDPAILSLGSFRKLWEVAALIPKTTVLFGNLPTKQFYSDADMSVTEVERRTRELLEGMRSTGHPFILGSECDVLSVEGRADAIKNKVETFMRAGRD